MAQEAVPAPGCIIFIIESYTPLKGHLLMGYSICEVLLFLEFEVSADLEK